VPAPPFSLPRPKRPSFARPRPRLTPRACPSAPGSPLPLVSLFRWQPKPAHQTLVPPMSSQARSPPTTARPVSSPLTRSPARLAPCTPAHCARAVPSPPPPPRLPEPSRRRLRHHHHHGELVGACRPSSLTPPRAPIKRTAQAPPSPHQPRLPPPPLPPSPIEPAPPHPSSGMWARATVPSLRCPHAVSPTGGSSGPPAHTATRAPAPDQAEIPPGPVNLESLFFFLFPFLFPIFTNIIIC
jgi:hypothetical protein